MRSLSRRLGDGVAVALFTALFLVFIVQIVARFGFHRPLPWTDELAVVLYVWVILWSAALVVPEREHVMFDLVWNAVGRRTRRILRIAGHAMLGGLCAWALPASWDYVHFMRREGTPVLDVSFMLVFAPFVLLMAALVVRSGVAIVRAWRGLDLDDAAIPSA
ncbi:TRAP transporter small permease [Sphaerotilus mobilis]|uniref:TRAP transporter small permease protein n=1 Tax=Sphaerotilus mobilis TaxID=47994 RepID=A0A4Q7LIL1_9BURK|nr:TRAP transporter small permease [Sphaerotilus mobilis]RZS53239.1 TRAP-type C4-dicarboxylate transport system permease small subunit [Sphaerotilus mobilis]